MNYLHLLLCLPALILCVTWCILLVSFSIEFLFGLFTWAFPAIPQFGICLLTLSSYWVLFLYMDWLHIYIQLLGFILLKYIHVSLSSQIIVVIFLLLTYCLKVTLLYLFFSCKLHPKFSFPSILSSQSHHSSLFPPRSISFSVSLQRRPGIQGYHPNTAWQVAIRIDIYSHIKSGWGNPVVLIPCKRLWCRSAGSMLA